MEPQLPSVTGAVHPDHRHSHTHAHTVVGRCDDQGEERHTHHRPSDDDVDCKARRRAAQPPRALSPHERFRGLSDVVLVAAALATIGLIVTVVIIASVVVFLIGRNCCDSCGGRSPSPQGYTRRQRCIPAVILFVCCALAAIAATFAYFENERMNEDVATVIVETKSLLDMALNLIVQHRDILDFVRADVVAVVANVSTALESSRSLRDETTSFSERMEATQLELSDIRVDGYSCIVCSTIVSYINTTNKELQRRSDDAFEELQFTIDAINTSLVIRNGSITSGLTESVIQLDDKHEEISAIRTRFVDIAGYNHEAHAFVMSLLFLPFLILIITLIGCILRAAMCIRIVFVVVVIEAIVMLMLVTTTLPISVFINSACSSPMNATVPVELQPTIAACVANASLLDGVDVDGRLDFDDNIVFPDIDSERSFGSMIFVDLDQLDLMTAFGFNSTQIDRLLVEFSFNSSLTNSPGRPIYNRTTIANETGMPGTAGPATRDAHRDRIVQLVQIETDLTTTLATIKFNLTSLLAQHSNLLQSATTFVASLERIESSILNLIIVVDVVGDVPLCGQLVDPASSIVDEVCTDVARSTMAMSICIGVIALIATVSIAIAVILWKRIGRHHIDFGDDDEAVIGQYPADVGRRRR